MPRGKSRPARWAEAAQKAHDALDELLSIQSEYEEWRDGVADNLQSGTMYEKLEAVCDLDIQGALDTIEEAEGADLPRGFGKD